MLKKLKLSISASDFKKKISSKNPPQILDIRTDEEFEDFNFGGTHVLFENLLENTNLIEFLKNKTTVIVCYTGLQSEIARSILAKKGFTKLLNLEGGIEAYLAI
jgi:rhodanese-related sulfurtransferase